MPIEAEGGKSSTADDEVFLTRGHSMRKRVSLEEVMVHMDEPVRREPPETERMCQWTALCPQIYKYTDIFLVRY